MLQKLFGFDSKTMTVRKEVIAGITTFLTMAYILAVNPAILGDAGMDSGAVFTASVAAAVISTLVMALYAKMPFALAPGMGLNAFFAYTIVITMGYSWPFALTAVFVEGIIFIILSVTGLRQRIVDSMPLILRRAISPGIGLFLAFIGLKNAGLVVANDSTFVTLGNFHSPTVLLACFGILLSSVLLVRKVTGALLIGILVTALIGIPVGVTQFGGIIDVPPSLAPVFCKFEWNQIFTVDMAVCVITFLFIDMFDTMGTLIGVCSRANMIDENGKIPRLGRSFLADAIGTTAGAVLGTSTVTTYVESASGVSAGGRSGLTAFSAAACFALALFFAPVFLALPTQATAPALILVGVMMMHDIRKVNFQEYITAIPCFICIVTMPLTYSISDGILLGLITYVFLHAFTGKWKEVSLGSYILAALFLLKYSLL